MNNRYWYAYQSGDDKLSTSYIRIFTNPKTFCPGGPTKCAVLAQPAANPNRPILSTNLQGYCVIAKGLQTSYPAFPDKTYVYTKP